MTCYRQCQKENCPVTSYFFPSFYKEQFENIFAGLGEKLSGQVSGRLIIKIGPASLLFPPNDILLTQGIPLTFPLPLQYLMHAL